jgi:hypothetical protein
MWRNLMFISEGIFNKNKYKPSLVLDEDIAKPKDPKLEDIEREYKIKIHGCDKELNRYMATYKGKAGWSSKSGVNISPEVEYKSSGTSKNYIKCRISAEKEYIEQYLEEIKKNGLKLCSQNTDKEKCEEWVKNKIGDFKDRMIVLNHVLKFI